MKPGRCIAAAVGLAVATIPWPAIAEALFGVAVLLALSAVLLGGTRG